MICVKVKKLTPSGNPQSGKKRRGPLKYAIVFKNKWMYLNRKRTIMFTVRPVHKYSLRFKLSVCSIICRAITQLKRTDPSSRGRFADLDQA